MTDPQSLPSAYSSGATDDIALAPADDEIALGWECANPALQIERWVPDLADAAQKTC